MAARFLIRNIVKLDLTNFQADIYLLEADGVGSYQVELRVTGLTSGVNYSYQSAFVSGMSIYNNPGAFAIAGFAVSQSGVTFGAAGVLIGTAVVNFTQAPTSAISFEIASPELLDANLSPMAYTSPPTAFEPSGTTVDILAYSWKAHTLLSDVSVSNGPQVPVSNASGAIRLEAVTEPTLTLTPSRAVPSSEATATHSAVNLQDAIAILKMIVGLDVNGAGMRCHLTKPWLPTLTATAR